MKKGILFTHFIEPTHVGTGEGLGTIDRPFYRESTTGFPTITGATLKGAMRGSVGWDEETNKVVFGADGENGNQGCVLWGDLKLLFLPVRSLAGTFAWATSMLALARLERSLGLLAADASIQAGHEALRGFLKASPPTSGICVSPTPECVLQITDGPCVVEGLVLEANADESGKLHQFLSWLTEQLFSEAESYWRGMLLERVLVVDEDSFAHLCRESLPVDANIRINPETGVTEDGSLRYTEFLPAETLMYSPITIMPSFRRSQDEALEFGLEAWASLPEVMQFGAEESKGKGVSRLCYVGEPSRGNAS